MRTVCIVVIMGIFLSLSVNLMGGEKSMVQLAGLRIVKSGYGLNGISSTTGELKYSKFRMGTNDSGRYSYTFEGVSEVPLGKVLQTLRKNIS